MLSMQNLHSIMSMSTKEYMSYIEQFACENEKTLAKLTEYENKNGHAFFRHCKKDEGRLAIEAIKTKRPRSTFQHEDDLDFYLAQAIAYNAKKIAEWLMTSKEIYFNMDVYYGEDTGIGFKVENDELKKCVSQGVTICLGRSHDRNSQTGFYLRTMYLMLDEPNTYQVIDNLGPIKDICFEDIKNLEIYGKEFCVESAEEREKRLNDELEEEEELED